MKFLCDQKYIILPASFHAPKKRLMFFVDGKMAYDLVVSLDYDKPDYRFPVNMERFIGREIEVTCDHDIDIVIEKADEAALDYDGKYRPASHFTAKRGWINDPNGCVYHDGKYLMYFQHNPAATTWENMHWGAAESTDLVHWTEKGDALFPDERGTMFSGSAIFDERNVSGLGKDGAAPILFFYTAAGGTSETSKNQPFTQCLAYSLDGGKTLIKYDKNPILGHIIGENRDPKVIYYAQDDSYIMALYLAGHEFALFKSKNLLDWKEIQRIELPNDAECPDFYPLPVDGDRDNVRWVFTAASDRYMIGSFDGNKYVPETEEKRLNYGNASYAAQSWSGFGDMRRVRTAFVTCVIPGMPFGCLMDLPQEMSIKHVNGELCLCAEPVREIDHLLVYGDHFDAFEVNKSFKHETSGKSIDVRLLAEAGKSFTVSLFGLDVKYDCEKQTLSCLDKEAKVTGTDGIMDIRILYDTVYAEIFADKGSVFMGMTYMQDLTMNKLEIKTEKLNVKELTVSSLGKFYE